MPKQIDYDIVRGYLLDMVKMYNQTPNSVTPAMFERVVEQK